MIRLLLLLVSTVSAVPQTLTIERVNLTNSVLQITPDLTNTNYYTLRANGNLEINGMALLSAYINQTTKISWDTELNKVYILQFSDNNTTWQDIRVVFYGTGSKLIWYDLPLVRSYRLKNTLIAPLNIKITKP